MLEPDPRMAILGRRQPAAGSNRAAARRSGRMANIRSQEKRIQRSERERLENRRRTSTVKTYFRRLERAIESEDRSAMESEYRSLVSTIDKAAEHGALHRNNAARKKARAARLLAQRSS
jgi:small subunit ribosomal protein S20